MFSCEQILATFKFLELNIIFQTKIYFVCMFGYLYATTYALVPFSA